MRVFDPQWDPDPTPARQAVAPVSSSSFAAPPAPYIALTPGYTPDYNALIQSDPSYVSWQNDSQRSLADAGSQRRAALQSLFVNYGALPSGFKDEYGDLDETTKSLAQGNQYSQTAQLQRSYRQGAEALRKALAARGALQSGDLVYGQDQLDYQRGASEYDLGRSFANSSQNILNNYVNVLNQVRSGQADALARAAQAVYANPLNRPVDEQRADLDPGWVTYATTPVYVGSGGTRLNADGTEYIPSTLSLGAQRRASYDY